jgi:hypothetical protein
MADQTGYRRPVAPTKAEEIEKVLARIEKPNMNKARLSGWF